MENSSKAQNIISLINLLQDPLVQDARTIVRTNLKVKPYISGWSDAEKKAASRVCSSYDLLGILIFQQKLVPKDLFLTNWGASIKEC